MTDKIRITILDDHPSIIDGYVFRLTENPQIEIAATINFGQDLEPTLAKCPTDVLLLDVNVPISEDNPNQYPILHVIPKLLQTYKGLGILVISMYAERGLIRAVMESGASGYVLKDDQTATRDLANVVLSVAGGGIYYSQKAHEIYSTHLSKESMLLSQRQLEALSLCGSYPNFSTADLAVKMSVSNSTVRNLLSAAYLKLDVNNRAAAIAKAQQLGLITHPITLPLQK